MQLHSIEDIKQHHRHIYLSPHFDDAVLSCGGTISLQRTVNLQPLVITIFGGYPAGQQSLTPFALQSHTTWGLGTTAEEAVVRRRDEDAAACDVAGADYLWLDNFDAIYRGYDSQDSLFGPVSQADNATDSRLADLLLHIQRQAPKAVIYAPLGVGHHVDHQLVCSAADRLVQQKINVKFYEDIPYVTYPGALEERQRELGIKMEPELVEIGAQVPQKLEAISKYRSQVPQLFRNEETMRRVIDGYAGAIRTQYAGIKIERYWAWSL